MKSINNVNQFPCSKFFRSSEFITETKPEELQVPGVTDVQDGRRRGFEDPSEPIYTDPSLFERSRSLRSISLSTTGFSIEAMKDH